MNKLFGCFAFFLVFVFTGLQATASADKTREYFEQDRNAYTRGAANYLEALPNACRYRESSLENHTFPDCFVVVEFRVAPNALGDKLFFKSGITNFAAALDSLLKKPANTNKWIIDCSVALTLAELQGIRCMSGNDELFNQWCLDNLVRNSNGFLASVGREGWVMQPDRVALEILKNRSQFLPGATVYFEQLKDIKNFDITGNNQAINMLIAVLQVQYGSVYSVKHIHGSMVGVNTICTGKGNDDQGEMVFFANSGIPGRMSVVAIADMLVAEMDADSKQLLTGEEDWVAQWRKICVPVLNNIAPGLDFEQQTTNFVSILGSICYNDKKCAARKILRSGQFYCFDFSVLRKSISVTAIKAFVRKFKKDEQLKAALLEAQKSLRETQQPKN